MNEKEKQDKHQKECDCIEQHPRFPADIVLKIDDTPENIARALFGLKPIKQANTPPNVLESESPQ